MNKNNKNKDNDGSDVKTVMLNEAKISRPRPGPWGRDRGQSFEVKAEAKDKVMNKKYQMMVDNIQANLHHYDQNDTLISHSLSHSNCLLSFSAGYVPQSCQKYCCSTRVTVVTAF